MEESSISVGNLERMKEGSGKRRKKGSIERFGNGSGKIPLKIASGTVSFCLLRTSLQSATEECCVARAEDEECWSLLLGDDD